LTQVMCMPLTKELERLLGFVIHYINTDSLTNYQRLFQKLFITRVLAFKL